LEDYFMQIHADLSQRAVAMTEEMDWVDSPLSGVQRRMLDRDGEEVARATSIVRYAPNSHFSAHSHGGGEEFLVLEGTFSDEYGDYGPGSYVRNPPGSSHTPYSKGGCTILVKLRQMDDDDQKTVRIDTANAKFQQSDNPSIKRQVLFERGLERVTLAQLNSGCHVALHGHPAGEEVFIIDGVLEDEYGRYPKGAWVRMPANSTHSAWTAEGALIWVKTGHLPAG
jgi:anti-sigma factor ChrR (cupin superfamily)